MIGLESITFPVFKVGNEPIIEGGVTFFLQTGRGEEYDNYKIRVVDDLNIKQPTLAKRRLVMKEAGTPLAKLSKAIFFAADLIKLANSKVWFIDSKGRLFNYRKSKYVPLTCHKVDAIMPIPSGGAIIVVNGVRYKTLYTPRTTEKYAGMLNLGLAKILYGLFEEPFEPTRRMI